MQIKILLRSFSMVSPQGYSVLMRRGVIVRIGDKWHGFCQAN